MLTPKHKSCHHILTCSKQAAHCVERNRPVRVFAIILRPFEWFTSRRQLWSLKFSVSCKVAFDASTAVDTEKQRAVKFLEGEVHTFVNYQWQ